MRNVMKYSIVAMCIGLTSACGGGGGGGGSDKANPAYDKTEINANTKVPSSTYVRDDLKTEIRAAKELTVFDPVTKQTIKTIQLSDYPKGTIKETFKSTENTLTTYMRIINLPYSNTVMFHTNETGDTAETAFFGGYPTKLKNLPKGAATYKGTSLGLNTSGSLTLTANFDDKSVRGLIYNRRHDNGSALSDIKLERSSIISESVSSSNGTVRAATFSGRASTKTDLDYYYGMFSGPNAEDVSGIVSDFLKSNVYESFAGEKQ